MTAGRRRARSGLLGAALLGLAGAFAALGIWQVERRAWKLDLIARVEARIDAPPGAAPGPAEWPGLSAGDEYRHVVATGRFLADRDTLVQAVTALGGGFWLIAPFRTDSGFTVLVNRGFVPGESRASPEWRTRGGHDAAITGLLRPTEPGGGFLRANDPATDRWYSRDVLAIAAARGLGPVAPYFVDEAAVAGREGWPRGGLTVVAFANNHLVYAITWFALALMSAGGLGFLVREERRAGRAG